MKSVDVLKVITYVLVDSMSINLCLSCGTANFLHIVAHISGGRKMHDDANIRDVNSHAECFCCSQDKSTAITEFIEIEVLFVSA